MNIFISICLIVIVLFDSLVTKNMKKEIEKLRKENKELKQKLSKE